MRKLTTFAMALMMGMMMLVSCNKDKDNKDQAVFHATIESRTQDRTYLDPVDGQGQIKWKAGDQIRIYNGNGESAVFTLKEGANTTNGTFTYANEFDMVPPFTAVYPHTATMNDADMVVFEVPAVQNLTETGTFANGANPMLAYGTDDNLYFQNLCGGLGVRLYGDAHVSSITVMGIEGEKLNGQFEVDGEDTELATSPYGDGGNNLVTLTCDVTLTDEVSAFYAVLPVGVLYHGVIVEIYDGETLVGQIPFPESHATQVVRNTIKSFPPVEVTAGGGDEHEYVDLGLPSGLLWATCNVGAEAPEEYGDYFAWGETEPKDTYTSDNYTFSENPSILPYDHDAATANWGGNWRMPTMEEWQELLNNTTVTWTQQGGVNGRLFTASNGNSLFLPAAGYRSSSSLYHAGSYGDYWSSSLLSDYPNNAWLLDFRSGYYYMDINYRYYGFTVRPVHSARQN